MRSRVLAVLSAVVIVAVVVLLYKVRQRPAVARGGSGSGSGSGSGNGSGNGSGVGSGSGSKIRGGSGEVDDGPQPITDVPAQLPQAELILAGEQALRAAATRCQPDGDPAMQGQKITLHYSMVFAEESAHVENLRVVDSDIGDRQLQDCILRQIGTARWGASGAKDATRSLQLVLRVSELRPDAGAGG